MQNHGYEIERISADGKTFFFNECESRQGKKYLAINSLYGENNRERMVVFPSQMGLFYNAYCKAMKEITGLRPEQSKTEAEQCPNCGSGVEKWGTASKQHPDEKRFIWLVYCWNCSPETVIMSSEDDDDKAAGLLLEEEDNEAG